MSAVRNESPDWSAKVSEWEQVKVKAASNARIRVAVFPNRNNEDINNNDNNIWPQHQGEDLFFPIDEQHERKRGVDDVAITTQREVLVILIIGQKKSKCMV